MSDRITPDSFFSDTHAFVAPQPVRFFFFSSPSQVLVYKIVCYIFTHRVLPHKKTLSSRYGPRVLQEERVFRPLLVTQLFRKSEKEEKNFLPCVRAKSRDAFSYQNASEADLFNTLIYSLSELLRLYYRDEFDHR